MKIKQLSELTNISKESSRYYESLGLLTPLRNKNGYREYSDTDLNDLLFILNLKKLNLTLEEISLLMNLKNQKTSLQCKKETLKFLETNIDYLKKILVL